MEKRLQRAWDKMKLETLENLVRSMPDIESKQSLKRKATAISNKIEIHIAVNFYYFFGQFLMAQVFSFL